MTIEVTKESIKDGNGPAGELSPGVSIGLGLLAIAQAIEEYTKAVVKRESSLKEGTVND